MISFGSKKTKSSTTSNSQSDPWEPTIPYLENFLGDLNSASGKYGPTSEQEDAFAKLKSQSGNPFYDQITKLANDQFAGVPTRSGIVTDAYGTLKNQLGKYASGDYLDFETNPYIQKMLTNVGNDVQNRVQGIFAGAGRDVVGNAAGQGAIAKNVTAAQLPILAQLFAQEQQNQIGAANALYGAGSNTAQVAQGLDTSALTSRSGAVPTSDAALAARDAGPNAILNLEQQRKMMPYEDMGLYASLLLSAAGLGGQQQGTSNTNSKTTGFGLEAKLGDIGKIGTAAMMLSDERAKENIEEVGTTKDGQKIYRYNYKGDDLVHIGLIAQEVEQEHPEAVTEIGGLKHVDYEKATADSVRAKRRA